MADETKDPLSLLAGDTSSSESEGEEEERGKIKSLTDESYYAPSTAQLDPDEVLPSPDTVFASVKTPDFLTTHIPSSNVNWDKLAKSIDPSDPLQPNPHSTNTHAAIPPPPPPPPEINSTSEISAAPVKYLVDEVDPQMSTVSSNVSNTEFGKVGDKRGKESNGAPSSKKQKGEIFREREKRKRDLGMSSRGKSFVEEEKRILREKFDK